MALKLDKEIDNNNTIFYYLKQTPTRLNNLKEFTNFFGDNPNNYHPNEMTAKFSEWFLLEMLKDNKSDNNIYKYENYKGYKIYKNYLKNMINKYYI